MSIQLKVSRLIQKNFWEMLDGLKLVLLQRRQEINDKNQKDADMLFYSKRIQRIFRVNENYLLGGSDA